MKKKFRAGDIVKFGYGIIHEDGKPSSYRTLLLLKKVHKSSNKFEELWEARLMNDSRGYYSDNLDMYLIDDSTELVWRARKKKVVDDRNAAC
jgi:hypothetical protein